MRMTSARSSALVAAERTEEEDAVLDCGGREGSWRWWGCGDRMLVMLTRSAVFGR
jgi:hypothetical protein